MSRQLREVKYKAHRTLHVLKRRKIANGRRYAASQLIAIQEDFPAPRRTRRHNNSAAHAAQAPATPAKSYTMQQQTTQTAKRATAAQRCLPIASEQVPEADGSALPVTTPTALTSTTMNLSIYTYCTATRLPMDSGMLPLNRHWDRSTALHRDQKLTEQRKLNRRSHNHTCNTDNIYPTPSVTFVGWWWWAPCQRRDIDCHMGESPNSAQTLRTAS